MSAQLKQVIQHIETLSSDEKALVAHCLISSLETKHDDNVDNAWGELAQKRLAQLESGETQGVPWSEIKTNITQ
ncbi:addiction module protein [Ghiorsea bivora]|uniref:addiction module protein n=1 Tax=Ghiorsea bivora TaxID=1485545 RepID=UPI00056F3754|nr:addiction module protein [Ghiorsea bivora]